MEHIFIHMAGAGAYLACIWYGTVLWTGRLTGAVPYPSPYNTGNILVAPEENNPVAPMGNGATEVLPSGVAGGQGGAGAPLPGVQAVLVCLACLCLLLLPAGRLPALVRLPWALGMIGLTLALGALVYAPRLTGGAGKSGRLSAAHGLLFLTALAALAFFAQRRGLPGDLGSVDSFVATPLWLVASGWGTAGLCGIFAGMALCLPSSRPAADLARGRFFSGCAYLLWLLLAHGLAVSLLAPWHLSALIDPGLAPGLALDFLGFWAKVGVSVAVVSRLVPETRRTQWAGIALLCAGQVVLVADALWGG